MENETTKTIEKKLRKLFRKKQRENFWLGLRGNLYQLDTKFPLDAYQELEENLTDDEFYQFKRSFEEDVSVEENALFNVIPGSIWFDRCCRDLRLFDSLSDEQLEKILNDTWDDISDLFFADGQNPDRQCRIMYLLSKERLDNWINYLTGEEFSKFEAKVPDFFSYLSEKTDGEAFGIFEKLASLSNCSVAELMENLKVAPARRILQNIIHLGRDVFEIVKVIEKDRLYDVVINKLDLLQDADVDRTEEWYSWLYSNLPEIDAIEFIVYLANEKRDELELFNAKICTEIFNILWEDCKTEFLTELFTKQGSERFEEFYELLSLLKEKEEMYNLLLDDKYGKEIVALLLEAKKEEDLGLLENLIKEKYVTQ